jgi:hypothetical protein|tara:strand:- start:5637 stop:5840 length:204 start_codon:yes stop_codon:yes gene_type:complete
MALFDHTDNPVIHLQEVDNGFVVKVRKQFLVAQNFEGLADVLSNFFKEEERLRKLNKMDLSEISNEL